VVKAGAASSEVGAARPVDNASNRSYLVDMRASTHISVRPAPDYALRVPSHLRILLGLGLVAGALGLVLLITAPTVPALVGGFLLLLALLSAAFGLGLGVITNSRLREGARRRMLEAVNWRGHENVLDVGCGNGFLLVEVAKRLTSGQATGIDLWMTGAGDQTPETAWRNARLEGVAERVDIKNVDARDMPFADETFDVIVSSLMLHHAGGGADRQRVLREMARVLKPGGTLLLYDVAPLIGSAARTLGWLGLDSIQRRGWLTAVLSARGPVEGRGQLEFA
jgi:arsenite methyltransferase